MAPFGAAKLSFATSLPFVAPFAPFPETWKPEQASIVP
jgi:hypothetical protein